MQRWTIAVSLLAFGYIAGVWAHARGIFPARQIAAVLRVDLRHMGQERGFKDTSGRREVDCERFRAAGTAILLTLGQSNASNEGGAPFEPGPGVYNFNYFDGRCYVAQDPLLGTTGAAGSPWSRLGDALVRRGVYEQVLLVPIAVGGSTIERWTPAGKHFPRIRGVQQRLMDRGLAPTHVLWHQGEGDARRTSKAEYLERFGEMLAGLRRVGIAAPVYVAVATVCGHPGSDPIRAAQREIPSLFDGVRPGPNTDQLDRLRHRRDGCHFSTEGLDAHAELWFEILRSD